MDRPVSEPLLEFRLGDHIDRLKHESAWQTGDRNAITLVKGPVLRVVLLVLHRGARLDRHRASGQVTVHVLVGLIRFRASQAAIDLIPGSLAAVEGGLAHEVEALEESAILLTLAV
jgi:quercetin dioxygenase-like cupin family protein